MSNLSEKQPRNKASGKPFQPGVSGNPKGRPKKGNALADILVELGEINKKKTRLGMKSYKEALAIKVWDLALKGTRWAAEFVRDTAYGKPIQKMEHGGFDGEAINLTFTTGTGPGPEERD